VMVILSSKEGDNALHRYCRRSRVFRAEFGLGGCPGYALDPHVRSVSYEWPWYVDETSDSGYIITGWTRSTAGGDADIYIVRLNQDGAWPGHNLWGAGK